MSPKADQVASDLVGFVSGQRLLVSAARRRERAHQLRDAAARPLPAVERGH
jgi:hypothetical protein